MQLIVNTSTSPPFNLALEEYFLVNRNEDVIMLWRNSSSVIIGYNQNAIEEVDVDYVKKHDIPVIRRQSGGGAVFHDLGNINFSVIHVLEAGDFSNYEKFTAPICSFLQQLGVDARLQGRNDLVIDGMKFSGNAQAVKGGRIMHHGTIMYNADVEHLTKALRPRPVKIESKGIKSIRSRVTNVADHLPTKMSADEFFSRLVRYFLTAAEGITEYRLTAADILAVNRLVEEKYGLWEWNFGRSPNYNMQKSAYLACGLVEVSLRISRGFIEDIRIYGDFFGIADKAELETALTGTVHRPDQIRSALEPFDLQNYIYGITPEQFIDLLL